MGVRHSGWRPSRLREVREAHGLTLEEAVSQVRQVTRDAGLMTPEATSQSLQQHERGEVHPDPAYRRAYCLLYRATEPELGLRDALANEFPRFHLPDLGGSHNGARSLALRDALAPLTKGDSDSGGQAACQQIVDAWTGRHVRGN